MQAVEVAGSPPETAAEAVLVLALVASVHMGRSDAWAAAPLQSHAATAAAAEWRKYAAEPNATRADKKNSDFQPPKREGASAAVVSADDDDDEVADDEDEDEDTDIDALAVESVDGDAGTEDRRRRNSAALSADDELALVPSLSAAAAIAPAVVTSVPSSAK